MNTLPKLLRFSILARKLAILGSFILLYLAGCAGASPSPTGQTFPTAVATIVESPAPTQTPSLVQVRSTPTATLTPSSPSRTEPAPSPDISMYQLLYFVPGAGGPGDCPGAGPEAPLPAGELSWMGPFDTMQQARLLCLYGFTQGEMVTIDLIDPTGAVADHRSYQAVETLVSMWDGREMTVIALQIDPNLFFERGNWLLRASALGEVVEIELPIGVCPPVEDNQPRSAGPYDYQAIHYVSVKLQAEPPESILDPRNFASYLPGESVGVRGACYPPNTQLPVGLFHSSQKGQGMTYVLTNTFAVTTDEDGSFETVLELEEVTRKGGYFALLPIPEGMRPALGGDFPDLLSVPYAGFEVHPLPDRSECVSGAGFRLGDISTTNTTLPVFSKGQSLEELFLGELPAGDRVEIVDGPVCAETRVLWRVHSLERGLAGWADQVGLGP